MPRAASVSAAIPRALSFANVNDMGVRRPNYYCRITSNDELYVMDLIDVYLNLGDRKKARAKMTEILADYPALAWKTTVLNPTAPVERQVRVVKPNDAHMVLVKCCDPQTSDVYIDLIDVIHNFARGFTKDVVARCSFNPYFSDEEIVSSTDEEEDGEDEEEADGAGAKDREVEDFPMIVINGRNVTTTHDHFPFAAQLASAVTGCHPRHAGQKLRRINKSLFDPALLLSRTGLSARKDAKTLVVSRFNATMLIRALLGTHGSVTERICEQLREQLIFNTPKYSVKNPPPTNTGTVRLVGFVAPPPPSAPEQSPKPAPPPSKKQVSEPKGIPMTQESQDPYADSMHFIPQTPSPEPSPEPEPKARKRLRMTPMRGASGTVTGGASASVSAVSSTGDSLTRVRGVVDMLTDIQAIPGLTDDERAMLRKSALQALPRCE